jgi:hypothetical protein
MNPDPDPVLTGSGSGLFSEVGSGPNRSGSATLPEGTVPIEKVDSKVAAKADQNYALLSPKTKKMCKLSLLQPSSPGSI